MKSAIVTCLFLSTLPVLSAKAEFAQTEGLSARVVVVTGNEAKDLSTGLQSMLGKRESKLLVTELDCQVVGDSDPAPVSCTASREGKAHTLKGDAARPVYAILQTAKHIVYNNPKAGFNSKFDVIEVLRTECDESDCKITLGSGSAI